MQNDDLKLDIDTNTTLPEMEQKVLAFWREENIFQKSLDLRRGKEKFTFYDGPPFANGLPHYGHMLAMGIKDLFVRYKTMRGYYVPRRNGWDTHGLPVEFQLEKELGLSGKLAIEEYGVDKFNRAARESVMRYADVWEKTIERMGRFIDTKNAYKTFEPSYIESVWWVFKQLWDKKLVYKDYAVQPYCPRCETSLSNFETNQGYKDQTPDPSLIVKFPVLNKEKEFILAWTTTPWTLPANVALAVSDKLKYGLYELGGEKYWLAQKLARNVLGNEAKLIATKTGSALAGAGYRMLFEDYYNGSEPRMGVKAKGGKVYLADFVTLDEGTGVVHMAPAYGEDDMKLARVKNLPVIFSTDKRGRMLTDIGKGLFIKDADPSIIKNMKERNLVFKAGTIHHTYPFCWRCDTPLIYMALSAWFVRVTAVADKLIEQNQQINWQPGHLRDGRFGKWLEGARDWNIGRLRFWGAPIPIWECDKCDATKIIDAISELEKGDNGVSKEVLEDPHKPQIDAVTFMCSSCKSGVMKRVPEVFDCWFESGSMPYAQWHYPFESNMEFEEDFPADFIAEGMDQTRGWFYTLHVLASALFGKPAYKNVVANGIIQAENGQKLSKNLRNYPEPSEIFDELGADALRQYLFSVTQIGEDYRFSKRLVAEEARKVIFPLWNSLLYYANYLGDERTEEADEMAKELDRWIVARFNETVANTTRYLDEYDLTRASRELELLNSDISLWYLRLSRKRQDAEFAVTLRRVLRGTATLIAPFMPFVAEAVFSSVKSDNDPISVHLADWPNASDIAINQALINNMKDVRNLVAMGHEWRARIGIKARQPLLRFNYSIKNKKRLSSGLETIISQELNVKESMGVIEDSIAHKTKGSGIYEIFLHDIPTPALILEGDEREVVRAVQSMRKEKGLLPSHKVNIVYDISKEGLLTKSAKWTERIGQQTHTTLTLLSSEPPQSAIKKPIALSDGEVVLYML